MSITDKIPVKSHIEVRDEILSIQKSAIIMASNCLPHKIDIHKKPVNQYELDYLAAYFTSPIQNDGTSEAYIKIVNDNCNIIVGLKTEDNGK